MITRRRAFQMVAAAVAVPTVSMSLPVLDQYRVDLRIDGKWEAIRASIESKYLVGRYAAAWKVEISDSRAIMRARHFTLDDRAKYFDDGVVLNPGDTYEIQWKLP